MTTLTEALEKFVSENGTIDVRAAFYAGAAVMAERFARADVLSGWHELIQLRSSYVYVWSFQRGGWWKPNEHGYTLELSEAGRYSFPRAQALCERANVRHVQEAIVPVNPLWLEYGLPAGAPGAPE